jgi:N-(2-amino-2-carboxyethyl)-L-glutamate synthase
MTLIDFKTIAKGLSGDLNNLIRQIGNTPLQPINLMLEGRACRVHLKLEGANPTGSIKDRTGYALIQDLEDRGMLYTQSNIIESTSGNLGVALALLCKARGYRFTAVLDPRTTQENIVKMQLLGAHTEMVHQPDETGGYLLSRLARVRELCHLSADYIWTDQYSNPANPYAHYAYTGPEIYRQMHGEVDVVFAPVSTGGTLAGIGGFFRKISPATHIIGVDAHGSVIFGTPSGPRKLTGIGSSRPSNFLTQDLYDTHMLVRDEEAFAFCRALYDATGIYIGGSGGAVVAACTQYLLAHPQVVNVVCVCPDSGANYASSIFNDAWLQLQGFDLPGSWLGPLQGILLVSEHTV